MFNLIPEKDTDEELRAGIEHDHDHEHSEDETPEIRPKETPLKKIHTL